MGGASWREKAAGLQDDVHFKNGGQGLCEREASLGPHIQHSSPWRRVWNSTRLLNRSGREHTVIQVEFSCLTLSWGLCESLWDRDKITGGDYHHPP